MTHHLLNYPQKMRSGGYRVTPQRKIILDAICGAGRQVTVEDIILRVRKKAPALNRATVYRNLLFLQKMHLVDAAGIGKGRKFEIAGPEPHHHLLCRKCGGETGLDVKYVRRLKEMIRSSSDFVIDDNHLSFTGICRLCLSDANRKSQTDPENSS